MGLLYLLYRVFLGGIWFWGMEKGLVRAGLKVSVLVILETLYRRPLIDQQALPFSLTLFPYASR